MVEKFKKQVRKKVRAEDLGYKGFLLTLELEVASGLKP